MGAHVSHITEDAHSGWIATAEAIKVAKFTSIASLAVAVYDYIACLDEEIELIWKSSISIFKVLALVSRYSGLVFVGVIVTIRLGDWNPEECKRLSYVNIVATDFVLLSSHYVLALRTAALYTYERKVCSIILIGVLLQTACAIAASTSWDIVPLPPGIPGCFARPGPARSLNISLYWPPALLTDLLLFVLTIHKVFPIWAMSKGSGLSWIVLRDELLYYGLVSSLTLATNVLMYQSNRALGPMIAPISATLSAVLVFHLVLNVRAVGRNPPPSTSLDQPITLDDLLAVTCMPSAPQNENRTSGIAVSVVSERVSEGEVTISEANRGSTRSEPITSAGWKEIGDAHAETLRKTLGTRTRQTV